MSDKTQAAIAAAQAILAGMNCKPDDPDYKEQFAKFLAEQQKLQAEAAAEERRLKAEADAEERRLKAEADAEERRLKAEADAEERRLKAEADAEERKLLAEAEERRLAREHEFRMAQQQQNNHRENSTAPAEGTQQRQPLPRVLIDILPFSPASERADRFIRRFETVLTREQVPRERFAEQLMKALPQQEAAPLLEVPIEEQFDYDVLKELFLRRHRVTETQLRDDFRNARPSKEDTAATFLRTLGRTFDYWFEATGMEKEYDNLRDRLIADQVADLLPNHLLILLRENQATTVADITAHLDAYFYARPTHSLHQACQQAYNRQHAPKTMQTSKPGPGNFQKTVPAPAQGQVPTGPQPTPASQPPSTGHTRQRTPTATPPSTGAAGQNVPQPGRHTPPAAPPTGAPAQYVPYQTRHAPQAAPRNTGATRQAAHQPGPQAPPPSTPPTSTPQAGTSQPNWDPSPRQGCAQHGPRSAHTSEDCWVLHPERRPTVPPTAGQNPITWQQPTALSTSPRNANVAITGGQTCQEVPDYAPTTYPTTEGPGYQEAPVHALATLIITDGSHPHGNLKTCVGTLDSQPVTVLLDTGSDSVFVAKRLVDSSSYTGGTVPVRTSAELHPGCPIARANFRCPYYPKGTNRVVVLDDPPFDVLLGQVPGTYSFGEDLSPPPASQPAPDEERDFTIARCPPNGAIAATNGRDQPHHLQNGSSTPHQRSLHHSQAVWRRTKSATDLFSSRSSTKGAPPDSWRFQNRFSPPRRPAPSDREIYKCPQRRIRSYSDPQRLNAGSWHHWQKSTKSGTISVTPDRHGGNDLPPRGAVRR